MDDFLAQATPEAKLKLIREYQTGGRLVAMTGDGTNDAPVLAQADVAVAMNSGTQAAKEAGNMVDLDSNPTKLIEVVEIGKQLLITRGADDKHQTEVRKIVITFRSQLRPAIVALIVLTIITGVLYPLLVTGIAQVVFPSQANGSLIVGVDGKPLGSALIGQEFSDPRYFWSRPSATGPVPYTAFNAEKLTGSSGSNYGPLNEALIGPDGIVQTRIKALREADPGNTAPIPVDLVTASGSGLDAHISPAAAEYQVARVARARGLDETQVRMLVARYTEGRQFGILGEPRANVLELNLALNGRP